MRAFYLFRILCYQTMFITVVRLIDFFSTSNVFKIKNNIGSLTTEAKNYLLKLGIQPNKEIETSLEMRYVGQAFEVPVKLTEENVDNISLVLLQKLFAEAHHKIFEFSKPEGDPVEVISIRVGVGEKTPKLSVQPNEKMRILIQKELRSIL